ADRAEQVLGAIHAALRAEPGSAGTHLTIRYSSADRAGTSVRRIRPLRIETDGARSYLLADCELAEGRRRFRLDRIVELLSAVSAVSGRAGGVVPSLAGVVGGGVGLRLGPAGHGIADSFAVAELRAAAEADVVGSTVAWLEDPLLAPLVEAVLVSAGAAEVL